MLYWDWLVNVFIEFNVELLLLVINDYCYIIVKVCKYVNIIKNKNIKYV